MSPYGTFDQGGNVQEFTEAVPEPDIRRIRGGSWRWGRSLLSAPQVDDVMHSSDQFDDLGFRVAMLDVGAASVLPGTAPTRLRFAVAGPHPFGAEARFRIQVPEAGRVHVDVFDIAGRRLPGGIDRTLPSGVNEVSWQADGLPPGVYLARVTALGQTEVIRFVHVR